PAAGGRRQPVLLIFHEDKFIIRAFGEKATMHQVRENLAQPANKIRSWVKPSRFCDIGAMDRLVENRIRVLTHRPNGL
ncbi:MAG TPA: hypothetical protein PKJ34_14600, partial [Anaerolineaceae bacterium]|nr:hypothetical protein [Anaerolineaceae bacterium]